MKESIVKKVCLVNGSLRGARASSLEFLNHLSAKLTPAGFRIDWITVRPKAGGSTPQETMSSLGSADAIILAFPLFSYTLPGALTALLEDFLSWASRGGPYNMDAQVFAIVNCGFPEPWTMRESIRVVKSFCARMGLRYRFSIAVSSGPVTAMTMKVPLLNPRLKRAFAGIVRDILHDGTGRQEDLFIKPIIPKAIILKIKEHYEKKTPVLSARKMVGR